jgi:hypothetical protein
MRFIPLVFGLLGLAAARQITHTVHQQSESQQALIREQILDDLGVNAPRQYLTPTTNSKEANE